MVHKTCTNPPTLLSLNRTSRRKLGTCCITIPNPITSRKWKLTGVAESTYDKDNRPGIALSQPKASVRQSFIRFHYPALNLTCSRQSETPHRFSRTNSSECAAQLTYRERSFKARESTSRPLIRRQLTVNAPRQRSLSPH
jgi:hypothetical protein